ncbi:MAG: hypothetical protein ABI832_01920 [bacterium]
MTRANKLLTATSLLALLAVPAFADTMIGGDAGLDATLHATLGNGANVNAGASASTDATVNSDGSSVATNGASDTAVTATTDVNGDGKIDAMDNAGAMASVDPNADAHAVLIGHSVWSKDGKLVGKVENVGMTNDGKLRLTVAVDAALQSDIRRFSVDVDSTAKLDGDLKLGWSEADLMTTLDADAKTNG